MDEIVFSDAFCRFLRTAIPTIEAAELLIFFKGRSEAEPSLSADQVTGLGSGISPADVAAYIRTFIAQGLLIDRDGAYQYNPASPHADNVLTLQKAYSQRPVTLIRVIYGL